jgi:hypothetical protein
MCLRRRGCARPSWLRSCFRLVPQVLLTPTLRPSSNQIAVVRSLKCLRCSRARPSVARPVSPRTSIQPHVCELRCLVVPPHLKAPPSKYHICPELRIYMLLNDETKGIVFLKHGIPTILGRRWATSEYGIEPRKLRASTRRVIHSR